MGETIELEAGRPIPPAKHGNAKYPFAEMAIGDSFALPCDVTVHSMRATARYHAKRHGRSFIIRRDGEYRVWRVA